MATLAAYVEERRPRPGQAVVISPEFIVEYLQDSLSRGRVILEDGTKTSSPFKLAERWSAARRDCANRPGNHSNPAESLLVLKWVDDHVSRCFLLGFKPQGAKEMWKEDWEVLMALIFQAHSAPGVSRAAKALHAQMGLALSVQFQTLFRGRTLLTLHINDIVLPDQGRGTGLAAVQDALERGVPLPGLLQIWPKKLKACRAGINVKRWAITRTHKKATSPIFWLASTVAAHTLAGYPLREFLTPARNHRSGPPPFLNKPMRLDAYSNYISKLLDDGQRFTGHSVRRGRAQELVGVEGMSKPELQMLLGHVDPRGVETYLQRQAKERLQRLFMARFHAVEAAGEEAGAEDLQS